MMIVIGLISLALVFAGGWLMALGMMDMRRSRMETREAVKRRERELPLPPWILMNALQDRPYPASGRLLSAKPITLPRSNATEREAEASRLIRSAIAHLSKTGRTN